MRCTYTTLCNKVSQWLVTGRWFSPGTPVSSTNKTDRHNIADIFLKVAFNIITLTIKVDYCFPIISSIDHIRVDNVRHTFGYFFYRKLYNGGNCSTIWQNKVHSYLRIDPNFFFGSWRNKLKNVVHTVQPAKRVTQGCVPHFWVYFEWTEQKIVINPYKLIPD